MSRPPFLLIMVTIVGWTAGSTAEAQVSRASTVKENRAFVYHGKLVRPDGTVPEGTLPVTLKIYSPDPSLCLLWQETQNVNFANGGFAAELGHSVNRRAGAAGGAASDFKQVFINNSALTIPSADCAVGNSYTPQAADDRLLFASIIDGGRTIEVAAIPIKSVPYALQAEEIGGYGLANLMKISGGGSSTTFTPAETQSLKDLLGGDLSWDMKTRKITNLADPTAATDAATRGWVISQINSSGGGTISSIGFAAPSIFSVTGSPLTANGSITLALAPQNANKVFAGPASGADAAPGFRPLDPLDVPALDAAKITTGVFSAARIPAGLAPGGSAGGDLSGTYPGPNVAKLQGNAVSSTTLMAGDAGKAYVWNGSALTAIYFGIADLKNAVGTSYYPQCGPSQTLNWVSATDTLTCASIAISDAAVTYASQAQNKVFASPNGSSGAPTYRALVPQDIPGLDWSKITSGKPTTLSGYGISDSLIVNGGQAGTVSLGSTDASAVTLKTNNAAALTVLPNGNIGVGTTSPSEKIEIAAGKMKAPEYCIGNSCITAWPSAGGSGTVTGVGVAGLPLSVTNATTTPQISIAQADGTTAGYLSAADWNNFNGKQPAGAYLTSITSGNVTTALGFTPVSNSLPTGQVYLGNGSNVAAGGFLGIGQLRNNLGTLQMPTSCTAAQTLTWSAVTDVLACTNIAIANTAVSGLGALATKSAVNLNSADVSGILPAANIGTGTADATKYLRGDGSWQTLPSGADNLGNHTATQDLNLGAFKLVGAGGTSGLSITASGQVGVGTSSPAAPLEVAGTIRADTLCDRNGANCKTINTGWTSSGAASSIVSNFPDVLYCQVGAEKGFFWLSSAPNVAGKYVYSGPGDAIKFNADGSYNDMDNNSGKSWDCGVATSIATLTTMGRTFMLAGGGGNIWTLTGANSTFVGGNVGIGTTTPGQKLTVAGVIESTSGGIKFPDGTTQTTAATGATAANVQVKTTTERDALTPTAGLVIFNSTTNRLEWANGTGWFSFGTATSVLGCSAFNASSTTKIGNATGGGGLAAAFDGITSQISGSNARSSGSTYYIGVDWGAGNTKTVCGYAVYGPNNASLSCNQGGTTQFNLYGSNTAPSSYTNGTLLATFSMATTGSAEIYNVTTGITETPFRYVWLAGSTAAETCFAEIVFNVRQ